MRSISNEELELADVPAPDASWDEIESFALSFNGYLATSSFEACAAIAAEGAAQTLAELRACLFFEQRSWRHAGNAPGAGDLAYIRTLVERIRTKVAMGDRA
jgi:hypothetical protein